MPKIVLDAGHGGRDSGAIGHGLQEKAIVLKIAQQTKKILETNYSNVTVIMTREGDTFPSLAERTKKANTNNADLFVSFHCNAATTSQATGFETYIHNGTTSTKTKTCQAKIHAAILSQAPYFTDRGKRTANFQVLRDTKMSAVLVEYGFITNEKDSNVMKDSKKLDQLALATAQGIADALSLAKKPAAPNTNYKVVKQFDDKISADNYLSSLVKEGHKGFSVQKDS